MYLDATVVTDKTERTKAIHKEADAGPRRADHIRQSFLSNRRNEGFRFAGLAEFRHQEEDPRQTLFAGVEQLIDKICLGSHAAGQQELEKQVGECGLVMHHSDHFVPADLERCTGVHGSGGGHMQPDDCRERLLSDKIAGS